MIEEKICNIAHMSRTTGERIKQRRKELKMSQTALGKLCGVSHAAVGLWESGQNRIGGENLVKAAQALKTTPEWIINGDTKQATEAADQKFAQWVLENAHYLNEGERNDIETLIVGAKNREELMKKYK